MLVDSHCHLDFPDFDAERGDVVARARAAGVGHLLTICTRLSQVRRNLDLVEPLPDVSLAVGVHPHEADGEGDVEVDRLVEIAAHAKVVGIGETGLDYYYAHSAPERQQASFRTHIRAARAAGLPVIVHTRDAEDDTIAILRDEAGAHGTLSGILHCFSGTRRLAEAAVELGMHISFSGILTFKRAEELRETARALPEDRLLVETDAPYLAPVPKRGKRNEPAFVVHTAACLAEARGVDPAAMARATSDTFFRLFDKVPAPAAPCA